MDLLRNMSHMPMLPTAAFAIKALDARRRCRRALPGTVAIDNCSRFLPTFPPFHHIHPAQFKFKFRALSAWPVRRALEEGYELNLGHRL